MAWIWLNRPETNNAQNYRLLDQLDGCFRRATGLMLAMICDMIVASDDAFFQDSVVRMGVPGVEYSARMFELPTRLAREFMYLGLRMPAQQAYDLGMINRVVPRDKLEAEGAAIADDIATRSRFGPTPRKR